MAEHDHELLNHLPPAYAGAPAREWRGTAAALWRDPHLVWAHPLHWQQWSTKAARCTMETLSSFVQDIRTSMRVVDVDTLDWLRPLAGIVTFDIDKSVARIQYDEHQPHAPSERYMCRCRQCPDCGAVWQSPYSMRVCSRCDTLYLPNKPARRQCECLCTTTLSLDYFLDCVRHGEYRVPQLCHYLYGMTEKHTDKARARARARARAHAGGSRKRNKALK